MSHNYNTSKYLDPDSITVEASILDILPFRELDDNEFCTLLSDTSPSSLNVHDLFTTECFQYDSDETPNCIPDARYVLESEFKPSSNTRSQFSLLHFNARSLSRNFDHIHSYFSTLNYPFSVIGISETWINSNIILPFDIEGYTFLHVDRKSGRGGGVGLYIRNDLQYKIHSFPILMYAMVLNFLE